MAYLFFDFFFFKQKTAYEIWSSDWSSDVCSSDLAYLSEKSLASEPIDLLSIHFYDYIFFDLVAF